MKPILLLVLSQFLHSATPAASQPLKQPQKQPPPGYFYVTGLRGQVINKRISHSLQLGDKIYSTDTLVAATTDFYLSLINQYGQFVVSSQTTGEDHANNAPEFLLALTSDLKKVEIKNADTRQLHTNLNRATLSRLFHPGDTLCKDRILLLASDKIAFDATTYPQDQTHYFFIRPAGSDNSPIRRLQTIQDSLELSGSDFQQTADDTPTPSYYLYYRQTSDGVPDDQRLVDFRVRFISRAAAGLIIDNFLKYYPRTEDTNLYDLETSIMDLFARCYQAAPRGAQFGALINGKIITYTHQRSRSIYN